MTTTPNPHALNLVSSVIEVNDVVSIVETDPVHDTASGDWVRDIQVYRQPEAPIWPDYAGESNPVLVLTIRLKGEQKSNIFFHAPGQTF